MCQDEERPHEINQLTLARDIVAHLGALCRNREDDPEVGQSRQDEDGMAVLEKMELWQRKENEASPAEGVQKGLFEGVPDEEEEDIAGNAKMAIHRDYVLSSSAYRWFIASLRRQLSLDWGSYDLTETTSCRQIGELIMSKMSSGIISKHRPPEIHRTRFRIKFLPDVFRCFPGEPVNLTTLTSSAPNIIQASTLQEYLDRTWPTGGTSLAKLIQKSCCGEDGVIQTGTNLGIQKQTYYGDTQADLTTDNFDNDTQIAAQLEKLEHTKTVKLLVTVSGPPYSIAQCGEQLAWLGAVFQTFRSGISICTCSIESQDECEWAIRYSPVHILGSATAESAQATQRLCDTTIIQGFPTQKRPPLFQGLELGLAWMLERIGASWIPVLENGRIVLKGSQHTLELVKHTQNILLWHILHSKSASCSFYECASSYEHNRPPLDSRLQTATLSSNSRHIIANKEHFGVPFVDPGEMHLPPDILVYKLALTR